jgi:uncharacterized integral membrane protein
MESTKSYSGSTRQSDATGPSASTPDRKRVAALAIIALVAIWLVAFILSNSETVRVSFVFGHIALSLIWVMIICAVLGAGLAFAIPRFGRRR